MYLFLLATLASCQSCSSDYKDVDDIVVEGVETPVLLGDPFIMLHDGTYYAYGTHADEGIEVYTSDDLKTWKYKGMALQKKDVWADRWFWAPEVYEVNGKFYMHFSSAIIGSFLLWVNGPAGESAVATQICSSAE